MVNYRDILPAGATPHQQPPIRTSTDAAYPIFNEGPILIFGDTHGTADGHQAFIAMMDTMQRAHVTTLAIELPTDFNTWIERLQGNIRTNHLTEAQVQAEMKAEFERRGMYATGGDQTLNDMGSVIYAATQHNMKVVGVDDREDSEAFMKRMNEAIASNDPRKINDVLFSSDPAIAARIAQIAQHLPPGEKMAVLFGVEHSCSGEPQRRLVDVLRGYGYDITPIALDQTTQLYVGGECRNPPSVSVDAPTYVENMRTPETQIHPKGRAPHVDRELAKPQIAAAPQTI